MKEPIAVVNSFYNSITYILPTGNAKECWLIDCGDVETILGAGWTVKGVFLTHAHSDHIYGINKLISHSPAIQVFTNMAGLEGLLNPRINLSKYHEEIDNFIIINTDVVRIIVDSCRISLDYGLEISIIPTPGHDPSCLSYRYQDYLFTGDSYIPGVSVVTSLRRSNKTKAIFYEEYLKSLEATGLQVKPGHRI